MLYDISTLGLHDLSSLKVLYLEGLTFLNGLEGLGHLEELCLDKNRIKHMDGAAFSSLPSLRQLRIEENGLRTFSNMYHLTNLRTLHCGYNRISELGEIDEIGEIPQLRELNLCHNSVSRKTFYRQEVLKRIPSLNTIDSKDVSPDERNRALYDGDANEIDEHLGSLVSGGGGLVSVLSIGLPESSKSSAVGGSSKPNHNSNNFFMRKMNPRKNGSGAFIPKSSTKIREIIHRSRLIRDAPTKISSVSSMRAIRRSNKDPILSSSIGAKKSSSISNKKKILRGNSSSSGLNVMKKGRWKQKLSTRVRRNF